MLLNTFKTFQSWHVTFQPTENPGNQVEEGCANGTTTATVLPGVGTVKGGHSRGSMDTRPHHHNKLIQKDQNRKTQSYKVESVSGGANMDMHNFSLESKRETEYVSHRERERERMKCLFNVFKSSLRGNRKSLSSLRQEWLFRRISFLQSVMHLNLQTKPNKQQEIQPNYKTQTKTPSLNWKQVINSSDDCFSTLCYYMVSVSYLCFSWRNNSIK